MANYFLVEPLLVARIEAVVDASVGVHSAPDLATVLEAGDRTPAVYVTHGQDVIREARTFDADDGITDQSWIVAVKVRHGGSSAVDARADGGTLIDSLLTALRGYQLDTTACGPLRRVTAPRDLYDGAGLMVYPLQFQVRLY